MNTQPATKLAIALTALSLTLGLVSSQAAPPPPQHKQKRPDAILEAVPETPVSTFGLSGRNPFMLPTAPRTVVNSPVSPVRILALTDEELKKLKESLKYSGQVISPDGSSVAVINGNQFFLNRPAIIELNRADLKVLRVVAEVIESKRVVLRLLDNTNRTIELSY